nr:MAG TPA: hypothetical protein [Caudoviricetes sp.]
MVDILEELKNGEINHKLSLASLTRFGGFFYARRKHGNRNIRLANTDTGGNGRVVQP